MKKVSVILVAAGEGKRFGSLKQFSLLKGKSVLDWSLDIFDNHEAVKEIILVIKGANQKEKLFAKYKKITSIVEGGEQRQDSVKKGFDQICPQEEGIVLVHDAVRPLVGKDIISAVIRATFEKGAVIPAIPVEDTIKVVNKSEIQKTLKGTNLFKAQTPQGFSYFILKKAFEKALREKPYYATDEATLVEKAGEKVHIIEGSPRNIKITTLEDLEIAEALIEN